MGSIYKVYDTILLKILTGQFECPQNKNSEEYNKLWDILDDCYVLPVIACKEYIARRFSAGGSPYSTIDII